MINSLLLPVTPAFSLIVTLPPCLTEKKNPEDLWDLRTLLTFLLKNKQVKVLGF